MKALPARKSGTNRNRIKRRKSLAWFFNWKKDLKRGSRKRRRVFSKYATFFLVLGVSAILAYVAFFSPLFLLSSIEVAVIPSGTSLEEESLKQEIKKNIAGSNLLFLKHHEVFSLSDNLSVEGIEIKKKWPHTLQVEIRKRVGRAVLEDSMGRLFLVDGNGVVFSRSRNSDLPLIKYLGIRLFLGDTVAGREIDFILRVLDEAFGRGLVVESIRAGTDAYLKIVDGPEVILALDGEDSMYQMFEIIEDFKSREEILTKIDLRYKNPVIEY